MIEDHVEFDPWGVGEALHMSLRMYAHAKRATGRTTLMVGALRDGDLLVTATRREAERMAHLAAKQGVHDLELACIEGPDMLSRLHEIVCRTKRRLMLDHTFIEALYYWMIVDSRHALARMINDNAQRRKSYGVDDWKETITAMGGDMSIAGGPND